MAEISVNWDDENRVAKFTSFLGESLNRAKRGLREAGLIVERQIKLNLSGPGRRAHTYWDAGSSKARLRAAASGEDIGRIRSSNRRLTGSRYSATSNANPYPGVITGTLRASVSAIRSDSGMVVDVGPHTVYARIHEFGGMAGRGRRTWIPPRPYVRPAWKQSRDAVMTAMSKAIHGDLR